MHVRAGRVMGGVILSVVFGVVWWAGAGSLTPPLGPVAPTMKPLSEIEPRINLNALPGSGTAVHEITAPGSYYLTADVLGVAGLNGIEVLSRGVSIDLNGFSVIGDPGALDGIRCDTVSDASLSVRNGEVRDWPDTGIRISYPSVGGLVTDVRLTNNGDGVDIARGVVSNCVANYCGRGFSVTEGRVLNCVANSCGDGIDAFFNTVVDGCSGKYNSYGIFLAAGSVASNNAMSYSWAAGIYCYDYSRAIGNVIDESQGDGIVVDNAFGNGLGSVVEDNVVTRTAGIGIGFLNGAVNCFAARNKVHDSGLANYDMGVGNAYGPIVNVAGAGDISGVAGSEHPQANYEY